jgi:hypothetical protein
MITIIYDKIDIIAIKKVIICVMLTLLVINILVLYININDNIYSVQKDDNFSYLNSINNYYDNYLINNNASSDVFSRGSIYYYGVENEINTSSLEVLTNEDLQIIYNLNNTNNNYVYYILNNEIIYVSTMGWKQYVPYDDNFILIMNNDNNDLIYSNSCYTIIKNNNL